LAIFFAARGIAFFAASNTEAVTSGVTMVQLSLSGSEFGINS
jgi:hypothetical protein